MLTRIINVNPTPEELACEFSQMNDSQQAVFFNEIARLTEKWEMDFCFQLQHLTDNKSLTNQGRQIMKQIGEYAEKGFG